MFAKVLEKSEKLILGYMEKTEGKEGDKRK